MATVGELNAVREGLRDSTALAPSGTAAKVAIGGTSASVALPTDAVVIRIAANQPCYIKFGVTAPTATANDILFPMGAEVITVPAGMLYIAAIQDGAVTGTLQITRMV